MIKYSISKTLFDSWTAASESRLFLHSNLISRKTYRELVWRRGSCKSVALRKRGNRIEVFDMRGYLPSCSVKNGCWCRKQDITSCLVEKRGTACVVVSVVEETIFHNTVTNYWEGYDGPSPALNVSLVMMRVRFHLRMRRRCCVIVVVEISTSNW